jgi:C-terminal processing protease CtpA/Prc
LRKNIVIAWLILLQSVAFAQQPVRPTVRDPLQISLADRLKVFDKVWETVHKYFFDPTFNGVNWAQVKQKYRPLAEAATDKVQLAGIIQPMLGELHASHTGFRADVPSSPSGTAATTAAPTDNVRVLERDAIYLRLSFEPARVKWLADELARHASASAIVLDLRGNGGGGTAEQRKVFDLFFSAKTIFGTFRFQNGKEYTLESNGSKSAYRGRLIVLTDHNTQSAAETFSQGIQETGRGIVVGQQTLGVVLLGNHFKLPNQFDLHLAVGDYHTVKGVRLEGRGVIPDVAVDDLAVKDVRENRDPVLDRVNQLLRAP